MSAPRERLAYGVKEAAELLSLSVRTLENWIHEGLLPICRVGRKRLIKHDDLVAVLDRHRVGGDR